ncbi:hypothetical protein Vretimale_10365 [Volvox reticuliferus]|uniref:Uncharacterized protein n=1 Tax=Volvox reticuliferus TaxID=1737510 RepID=A0A8J4GFW2_9CHLO|nr:hypothetical protein Vretifemale_12423 [Volvox reticuliferus]GIM06057.1 hypothetical protein Vretimale_10365 [Volvox reticuliferus]
MREESEESPPPPPRRNIRNSSPGNDAPPAKCKHIAPEAGLMVVRGGLVSTYVLGGGGPYRIQILTTIIICCRVLPYLRGKGTSSSTGHYSRGGWTDGPSRTAPRGTPR